MRSLCYYIRMEPNKTNNQNQPNSLPAETQDGEQPVATANPFEALPPGPAQAGAPGYTTDDRSTVSANRQIKAIGVFLIAVALINLIPTTLLFGMSGGFGPILSLLQLLMSAVLATLGIGLIHKNKATYIIFYIISVPIWLYSVFSIPYIIVSASYLPLVLVFGASSSGVALAFIVQVVLYFALNIFFLIAPIWMLKKNIREQFRM